MAIIKNNFGAINNATTLSYYICDLDSEKPITGLNKGDFCHCIDTAKYYTAINSTTWQTFGTPALTVSAINNIVDGATITINLSLGNTHAVTVAGNRTLAVTNPRIGQSFIVRIKQDGVGSRTITPFAGISWAGGTPPVITTTANKADILGFICTSATTFDGVYVAGNL